MQTTLQNNVQALILSQIIVRQIGCILQCMFWTMCNSQNELYFLVQYILLYMLCYIITKHLNFVWLYPYKNKRIADIHLKCRKRYVFHCLFQLNFFPYICSQVILLLPHDRIHFTCHLVTNHVTDRLFFWKKQEKC